MRVLFAGSDKFGIPTLKALLEQDSYNVVGVITQPDRPTGRKQVMTSTPIKQFLLESGYYEPALEAGNQPEAPASNGQQHPRLYQPERLADDAQHILDETTPELVIVVAYGQIVPELMINYPQFKCLNIHGSLLPQYRGAVPIEAALLNGDSKTGVSILEMTPRLDDGPVLAEESIAITPADDAVTLRRDLAVKGRDLLLEVLPAWTNGQLKATPQEVLAEREQRQVSMCSVTLLAREAAEIKPTDSITTAFNKVRAFAAGRGAWLRVPHNNGFADLKILQARIMDTKRQLFGWGKLSEDNGQLMLTFPDGKLNLLKLQLAGKNMGSAEDYLYLANEKKEQVRAVIKVGEEILAIRRKKFGREYVVLPGGHIKAGESKVEALLREIAEETSIQVDAASVEQLFSMSDGLEEIVHVFRLHLNEKPAVAMSGDELQRQTADNTYELIWLRTDAAEMALLMPPDLRTKLEL